MTENIELNSYSITQSVESDSDEYHEIDQAMVKPMNILQQCPTSPSKQVSFFTQPILELKRKKRVKKAKHETSSNIMEIINFKIDNSQLPVIENVFNVVEENDQESYLQRSCKIEKILHVRPRLFDMECGLGHLRSAKLIPSFPNVEKLSVYRDTTLVYYVQPYMFKDLITGNMNSDFNQTERFLDISINEIKYTHHHEFSLEKILVIKLEEYYKIYSINEKSILETLQAIHINRQTRDNLRDQFTAISPSKKDDIIFDPTILNYTAAMLGLKEKYFNKIKERRELVNTLLSIWSDIRNVRQRSDTVAMSHVLDIKNIAFNEEFFSKEWNKVFQVEYSDMLIKLEYDYATKYLDYKKSRSNDSCVKNKITKPKLMVNPEEIKCDVEKLVNFLLKHEDIEITLTFDKRILKENSNSKIKHDADVKSVNFKVYVDDVFACESLLFKVEDFSKIDYNDSFTLQILQDNKILGLILCESNVDESAFTIDINEIHKKTSSSVLTEKGFVYYDKVVKPTTGSVGSGFSIKDIAAVNHVRLKSRNVFKGKLFTTCKVQLKVAWNNKLNKNQSCMKAFLHIENQIKRLMHGIDKPHLSCLLELISNIYDYDVEDESIVDALKEFSKSRSKRDDTFFVDENDYNRFKLLNLRNNGGFSKITDKTVPLFQSQITTEQLNSLQKGNEKELDIQYFESKRIHMDPIDLQRYMGMKFVDKLNIKIVTDLNERLLSKTHKDVVLDYQDLSLRSIFSNKSNLSLVTSSSVTRKQSIEDGLTREQEIQITILRAFNLSDRSTEDVEAQQNVENCKIAGYKVQPLRPFMRLNYHDESVQTSIAIGSHSTWNYTAKIKTKLEPLSSIYINIYDEYKENIGQETEASNQSFRYRCYNKWLGVLAIPINTVLSLGSVQGTFKITTPPIVFGYENSSKETTSVIPEIIRLMRKDSAFLTLRITTSLSHLGGLQFYNQPMDAEDHVIRHLNNFVTQYLNDFPTRNLFLTFIDSAGKNKCVTGFIQPLPIPEIILNAPKRTGSASKSLKKTDNVDESVFKMDGISRPMDIAVRYVSLIPTYEVIQSHVVTLWGIELLKVLYGSPLDHTLLLASYFIGIGIKCWVVMGFGLPRGLSSYVMVKYDGNRIIMATDRESRGFLGNGEHEVFIFDAVSGEKHDVRDLGCPLKTVSYAFDDENIWVNVQLVQDCESLSFDFTKSSKWMPVFNNSVFVLRQAAITRNVYSTPGNVEDLKNSLETKIKAKIQKWRWNIKTIWNRYLSNLLLESLPHWELWSFNTSAEKPALGHRLKQLMLTYKMFGFPLNMPFLNTKSVVSRVKSTMLHLNDDPQAEFGLAIEVFAYPNNVLSVWVFLASMSRI